jgi:hypothetical protein
MAGRTYHHERWSQDDDELLRKMSESRKSLTLTIVKLNKSMASIKSRGEELHINPGHPTLGERAESNLHSRRNIISPEPLCSAGLHSS